MFFVHIAVQGIERHRYFPQSQRNIMLIIHFLSLFLMLLKIELLYIFACFVFS